MDSSSADDLALEESSSGAGTRKAGGRKSAAKTTSVEEKFEEDISTETRIEMPQDADIVEPLALSKWEIIKESLYPIWQFTVDAGASVAQGSR